MKLPILGRRPTIWALFLLSSLPFHAAAAPANPEDSGPFPVGVTTIQLSDPARQDPALEAPRPLLAEFWYPASDSARGAAPTKFTDFYMGGENAQMNIILTMAFKFDITKMDSTFKTTAVRDAAIAEGTFPLLVFSHGNGGMRAQSTFWCDHMASHGFIVAAVDHTHNSCATSYAGKVIPYQQDGRGQAAIDRPKDVSFLIDQIEAMHGDPASRFHQHVNLDKIGVAGHSFGGFTAMAAEHHDDRIDAIAPMAAVVPEYTQASSVPLLLLVATEDDTIGEKGNASARAYWEATKAPKYLVELVNAGHYTFSDMYQINPAWGDGVGKGHRITDGTAIEYIDMEHAYALTNGYCTAFFTHYLKDLDKFGDYLAHNRDGSAVKYRTSFSALIEGNGK